MLTKTHPRPVISRDSTWPARSFNDGSWVAVCECGWRSHYAARSAVEQEVLRHMRKAVGAR